jgi:hypothetical protein
MLDTQLGMPVALQGARRSVLAGWRATLNSSPVVQLSTRTIREPATAEVSVMSVNFVYAGLKKEKWSCQAAVNGMILIPSWLS